MFESVAHSVFNGAYKSSNSMIIAFLAALLAWLLFFVGNVLWKSKFNMPVRISLVSVWTCLIGGCFYISAMGISRYEAEKKIQRIFSKEALDGIKEDYRIRKEIDIEKITEEICDRLKKCAAEHPDNFDKQCIEELKNSDRILENRFIVNECDVTAFIRLREFIIGWLEENAPKASEALYEVYKLNRIFNELACDPVTYEAYKILIEKGPKEYFQFYEQLFLTKEGRIKLKQSCSLRNLEVQLMGCFIDNPDTFKDLAINLLSMMPEWTNQKFSDTDVQQYIKNKFPGLLQSSEGRQKIMQDIQKLIEVVTIQLGTLCDLIEEKGNNSLAGTARLMEERVGSKIKEIIQTVGHVY